MSKTIDENEIMELLDDIKDAIRDAGDERLPYSEREFARDYVCETLGTDSVFQGRMKLSGIIYRHKEV